MKDTKVEQCPHCGEHEFWQGFTTQAIAAGEKYAGLGKTGKLEYTICKACGSIVQTKVLNLEQLMEQGR